MEIAENSCCCFFLEIVIPSCCCCYSPLMRVYFTDMKHTHTRFIYRIIKHVVSMYIFFELISNLSIQFKVNKQHTAAISHKQVVKGYGRNTKTEKETDIPHTQKPCWKIHLKKKQRN